MDTTLIPLLTSLLENPTIGEYQVVLILVIVLFVFRKKIMRSDIGEEETLDKTNEKISDVRSIIKAHDAQLLRISEFVVGISSKIDTLNDKMDTLNNRLAEHNSRAISIEHDILELSSQVKSHVKRIKDYTNHE